MEKGLRDAGRTGSAGGSARSIVNSAVNDTTSKTIVRVAILGGEASGKSTLAAALATHYRSIWVPEYLRDFVEAQQRTPHPHEQFSIAAKQVERETAALARAAGFLFCDTSPRMTAAYSRHYFGNTDAALDALTMAHTYDATIVTAPTIPWASDGLQHDSEAARQAVHDIVVDMLQRAVIPFLLVDGDVAQRVEQTVAYLSQLARTGKPD
jgi:NadR type nicotinamide-nucleotide adenylyltransferase